MRLYDRLYAWHRIWRFRLKHERQEIAFILNWPELSGSTAVDVGANQGIYSYWMHRAVGAQGNVVAFEPQPELVAQLHDFRRTFALDRLTIVAKAASSASGSRLLHRPPRWAAASLESHVLDRPDHGQVESIEVPVETLDGYFAAHASLRPVRLIKCDVEGHELEVLRGGETLLAEDRPALVLECYPFMTDQEKLFGFLSERGYEGFYASRRRLVPLAEHLRDGEAAAKGGFNFVFVPRERNRQAA